MLEPLFIIDRGQILDDLEIDFGDGFGVVGFAHMTDAQRAHVYELIPARTVVIFDCVVTLPTTPPPRRTS